MGMRQEMRFESGLLHVRVEGRFSLAEAKRGFLDLLEAVARHRAERVLFDGRDIEGQPDFMERFQYGEFVANETLALVHDRRTSHAPVFAYVLADPVRDPQRFGETVALNRGVTVKTFGVLEEALEWLKRPAAGRADAGDAR